MGWTVVLVSSFSSSRFPTSPLSTAKKRRRLIRLSFRLPFQMYGKVRPAAHRQCTLTTRLATTRLAITLTPRDRRPALLSFSRFLVSHFSK